MKKILLLILAGLTSVQFANAQTKTVTVDANDVLNNNTKIVAQTSLGQSFFTGHQLGSTYSYPAAGIFRAWTDQPTGSANYYYDGLTNGTINFSVRADGQGYFAGNVGIGTNAPTAKLHLFNQYDVNQPTALKMFYQGTWGTPAYASGFRFIDLNSTESGKVLQVNGTGIGIGYDPPAWSSPDKLYISGNVGIGTNILSAKFTVYNSTPLGSTAKNNVLLSSVSSTAGTANNFKNNLWLVRNAAGSDWTTARLHDGISVDVSFGNPQTDTRTWWERDPNQDIQSWGTSGNTYLSINAGNVGVGTIDTKGYKFAVNGNVIATSMTVKLYANWPDYVFKKDYTLPALTDVKTYIDENHHLPEIPSEQEVAKNGINLGEMNKLLLKKVEELTLYLIEKDKNEKENTAQLKLMAQEIANLKKQVTHLDKK
ncbi:hypothetical protein [Mucilaginibacter ginsenosidivorax]|uniref:Uncharacterized protein n=1 Tax=Mucilaginibacter ginsenosidivorax TaxID=862126 RepID=A0A5B8WAY4_9SPHI|nr:hypothetical protein [Mucilaginibacter ginsenosidivorax]QEC79308.1 hypothetical protein FSB76_26405 [Mucilaginibacter ginsenosidivorax]